MCMRLGLNHAKNGFLSRFARSMKSSVALRNSASTFSMRFLSSGPVSSQFCFPFTETRIFPWGVDGGRRAAEDAARTKFQFELGVLGILGVLRLVLGIEVMKVTEELIEAMHGR